MNSCLSQCDKEAVREQALSLGACRCGFARAEAVEENARDAYSAWIVQGKHSTMQYCAKYDDVRDDPRMLLAGCNTIITTAWAYPKSDNRLIAAYAQVPDYHYELKERLRQLGQWIVERWGGETRPLVDTAPMRERYWAQRSGIGYVGVNNMLIVPGVGSYVFLAELLWTGAIEPDAPCQLHCDGCKQCIKACPSKAISESEAIDARRCLSCLTIEHRGELPTGLKLNSFYGCDVCQEVCPHNIVEAQTSTIFEHDNAIDELTPAAILTMTPSHYRKITRRSAMQRASLSQLQRNVKAMDSDIENRVSKNIQ